MSYSTHGDLTKPRVGPAFRGSHLGVVAAICLLAASVTPAGASDMAYNMRFKPDHLSGPTLARVQNICVSELGLSASEPYSDVWGAATNPDLVGGENHFQGCVASLSASLRDVATTESRFQSDQDCRKTGLRDGSPELAMCVLDALKSRRDVNREAVVNPATPGRSPPKGSFFTASGREIHRRESNACAALGLNPAYAPFDQCVKKLDDTFFSIDNPWN